MTRTEFIDLLDAYWNAAYHEGEIAATTDTPDGRAGRINSALMREYDALAARLVKAQEESDRRTREVEACYTVQRDLKARLAGAERDAARYRWLRDEQPDDRFCRWTEGLIDIGNDDFDAAIDAAMGTASQPGPELCQCGLRRSECIKTECGQESASFQPTTGAAKFTPYPGAQARLFSRTESDPFMRRVAASQPSVARCSNCGGSGIIRWQAYDGTEEGHEEQDPCPVCTTDNSAAAQPESRPEY